jgi:hypothetical protein
MDYDKFCQRNVTIYLLCIKLRYLIIVFIFLNTIDIYVYALLLIVDRAGSGYMAVVIILLTRVFGGTSSCRLISEISII